MITNVMQWLITWAVWIQPSKCQKTYLKEMMGGEVQGFKEKIN